MVSKCKCVIFIIGLLANTFDLICDWLLYFDISGLQEGLVFGPFKDAVSTSLLVFSGIGSLIYVIDLVLNIIDVAKEDYLPLWLLDTVNMISISMENVPQIIVNVYIAGCRENSVSILQLAKALAAIVKVLTIIGVAIANHLYNSAKGKFYRKAYLLKIPIGIGLSIVLVGSLLILGLTHFFLGSRNVVQFSSPKSFNGFEYDTEKYFNGAGVYLNFGPGEPISMNSEEYIKLTDLTSITNDQSAEVVVSVTYNPDTNTRLWIQATTTSDVTSPETGICYSTAAVPFTIVTSCTADLPRLPSITSVVFKFMYKSPSNQIPLGDVSYSYRITTYTPGGDCVNSTSSPSLSLNYFKVIVAANTDPLVTLSATTAKFYSSRSNLQDISEAWKTGKFGCKPTGRASPRLDASISVPCLTWGSAVP